MWQCNWCPATLHSQATLSCNVEASLISLLPHKLRQGCSMDALACAQLHNMLALPSSSCNAVHVSIQTQTLVNVNVQSTCVNV